MTFSAVRVDWAGELFINKKIRWIRKVTVQGTHQDTSFSQREAEEQTNTVTLNRTKKCEKYRGTDKEADKLESYNKH